MEQAGSVTFDGETIEGAPPLWCAAAAGIAAFLFYRLKMTFCTSFFFALWLMDHCSLIFTAVSSVSGFEIMINCSLRGAQLHSWENISQHFW